MNGRDFPDGEEVQEYFRNEGRQAPRQVMTRCSLSGVAGVGSSSPPAPLVLRRVRGRG